MATLMSPFIMVSCVQESEKITYRGYFFRVAFFSSVPTQPRSRLRLLELAFFNQIPLPTTNPLNRNKRARLLGSPQSTKDGTKPGKDNVNKERMDK